MPVPLEGTRLNIVALLRERGALTVDQLAQELELAPTTIRRHLDILQRDHLVACEQVHKRMGRPEHTYHLTEAGYESGFRDYQGLATSLLSEAAHLTPTDLSGKDSGGVMELLLTRISSNIAPSYETPENALWEERIANLESVLAAQGFSPEVNNQEDRLDIRLWNCPFRAVALCNESVCLIDRQLIANTLGAEPVRQATIRDNASCCSYVVEPERAAGPQDQPR